MSDNETRCTGCGAIIGRSNDPQETGTCDDCRSQAEPRRVWAVQFAEGGIPQDPMLFDNEEAARRAFVEIAVANDLEFTDDHTADWIGNDDNEVRMWGPLGTASVPDPNPVGEWVGSRWVYRPLNETERAEVERILTAIREE